ncbi:MAG: protein kinase, partial [Acidobacteriota bacterium]
DVVRDKDLTYIVMQYVDGESLQVQIDSGKQFSPQEIIDLLKPISDGLDYAHRNGIVHRDIKPANILIDKSGMPFLADFGVARIETSTMTQAGTTVGTLSYMSPEQVMGKQVDSRADIFALGVIVYELLAGKKPFAGDNLSTIVYRIVHEDPQRVTDINKELPRGYEAVIQRALAKNPEDRYQSCREMIADLENPDVIAEASMAFAAQQAAALRPEKKRIPKVVLVGALFLVVIAAAASYLLVSSRSKKPSDLPQNIETIKKEGLSPVTRSGGPATRPATGPALDTAPAAGPSLDKLRESYEGKNFAETVRLAEEILGREPANQAAQDYLKKARSEIVAGQVAPLVQAGTASYNSGNYEQCIMEMEKALKIDKDHKEAHRYLFLADTALSKQEISALLERFRVAEENKDLLAVLSHLDAPELAASSQSEYKLLFNNYDGIKSSVSRSSVNFASRSNATTTFSQLLTAVYRKDGQRKILFEGQKTWELKRSGKKWKIVAIR